MPINFPTSLDTLTNPSSGDYLDSGVVPHHLQHSDANDAIEAIETKLGIDGSAVTTSIDYKLKNTGSIDPGHRHSNLWNPGNTFNALTIDANSRISIPSSGTLGGILFGADAALYRSAYQTLTTDSHLVLLTSNTELRLTTSAYSSGGININSGHRLSAHTTGGFKFALANATDLSGTNYGLTIGRTFQPSASGSTANFIGLNVSSLFSDAGQLGNFLGGVYGVYVDARTQSVWNDLGVHTHQRLYGIFVQPQHVDDWDGAAQKLTDMYGVAIAPIANVGVVANIYGLHISNADQIFTANNQKRVSIYVDGTPDPGGYSGTTAAAVQLAGTSGTYRDGILFGTDTNLYRSAADVLKTDDSFVIGTNLTVNSLTSTRVPYASTNGLLIDSANMVFSGTQLRLADGTSSGGILIGGDGQIYRRSADILALASGDSFEIPANVAIGTTIDANRFINMTFTNTQLATGQYGMVVSAAHNSNGGTVTARTWALNFTLTQSGSGDFSDGSALGGTGIEGAAQFSGTGTAVGMCGVVGQVTNSSTGTLTRAVGFLANMSNANSGAGHITNLRPIDVAWSTAFSANSQVRCGIRIGAGPTNAGSFSGSIVGGLYFNSDSGTAVDGIIWGTGGDTNLYRSAANTLRTDDSLIVASNLTVSTLTSTRVPYASTGGLLVDSANFIFSGTQLRLADTTSSGGLLIGGDTQLYRRAANVMTLATGDSFEVPANLAVGTTVNSNVGVNVTIAPGDVTANAVNAQLNLNSGNGGSAFPVAINGRFDVNSGSGTVSYAIGLTGQVRIQSGQSGNVTNVVGSDNFVWFSSTASATVSNFYGGSFTASIQSGAMGYITGCRAGSFGTGHNTSSITYINNNYWIYTFGSIPAGGITNQYGIYLGTPTRTTGTVVTSYGIYIDDLVAFTANNDTRIALRIDTIPNPGAFTGTTALAIDIAGTSRTSRDGIRIGGDTNLYSSAANVLATDDTLKLAAGTTTLAPLQFQNGTNLSTPVSGSLEVQGGQLYYTDGSGRGKVKIRATVPMLLMAGYTPTASGGDIIYKVPRVNGASVTFNVKRLFWRVETAAAGESRLRVEKYTGTGAFSATNMHTGGDLSMSGGSTYEASTTTFTTTTLTSDDKVRVNATLLNAQATWLVELELEEQ